MPYQMSMDFLITRILLLLAFRDIGLDIDLEHSHHLTATHNINGLMFFKLIINLNITLSTLWAEAD